MRIGVITFPGTLDDVDAARSVRLAGGEAVSLWHADSDLQGVDAVVLPGGFSYGDYLRCGAISRFAPIMDTVISRANDGMPLLGICNGFQILCEAHLLPGALTRNVHQRFICRDQRLKIERTDTAWTNKFESGQEIVIPLKNAEGCYVANDETINELETEGRVIARYLGMNPNGSYKDIAGVSNERGNVVGLMPHPEHATESGFGPDERTGTDGLDGLPFFTSVLEGVLNA